LQAVKVEEAKSRKWSVYKGGSLGRADLKLTNRPGGQGGAQVPSFAGKAGKSGKFVKQPHCVLVATLLRLCC
jgi:hypothetical protein